MIKAIIFDCFGVLTADLWLQFKEKYFADKPELASKASDLNRQTDMGLITYNDFIKQVAAMAGVPPAQTNIQIQGNAPNEQLFEYIRQKLKPHYKLGILSNSASNWLDRIFTPDQVALFDGFVLSYESGFIKPQPEIYNMITQKLGLEPSECVFVDDRQVYCQAAADLGMRAIYYQGFAQFKKEIEQILSHA